MKKLLTGVMFLALLQITPDPALAGVNVGLSISLPSPLVFVSPPEMIVIPETYVYAVPGVEAEIYFYNGWWWRPWEGHWYRSRHYDSGWSYYQRVPSFYGGIPTGWRNDYRDHRWHGQQWNYQPIPHQQLQKNWRNWEKNGHWEKQQTWGVQGLKPHTRSPQPSTVVQPKPQVKPQFHETAKPQQYRSPGEFQQNQHNAQPQVVKPQPQAIKPQPQRGGPPSHETARPQPQQRSQQQAVKPQIHEAARPQQPQAHPGAVPQQHVQPQHQNAPQQSHSQQGNPERGGEEKHDRK